MFPAFRSDAQTWAPALAESAAAHTCSDGESPAMPWADMQTESLAFDCEALANVY